MNVSIGRLRAFLRLERYVEQRARGSFKEGRDPFRTVITPIVSDCGPEDRRGKCDGAPTSTDPGYWYPWSASHTVAVTPHGDVLEDSEDVEENVVRKNVYRRFLLYIR